MHWSSRWFSSALLYNHASFAMLRWSNSKGFNLILLAILNIRSKPVRAHLAGMFIGGEKRSFAASGAGQGGRKICALMIGEVAEPFRWLCSTGCMLKFFHVSTCHASVMCLGGPPWAATQEKVAACAELWGLIFWCRVKVHTVKGVSMAKLEGPS
jgi:hypothetical protein